MKKILLIFCITFVVFSLSAQRNIDQGIVEKYLEEAGDHASLYYAPLEEQINAMSWFNHPFWEADEAKVGEVCFDGVVYQNVTMRFNVATQRLTVATKENRVFVTPDMSKVSYFIIDGKRFERHDERFWCLEYASNKRQLWTDCIKVIAPDVILDGKSYKAYREIVKHYVIDETDCFQVKKAKDVAKHYSAHRRQIQKFIRTLDSRILDNKVLEIVSTLEYLETLGL